MRKALPVLAQHRYLIGFGFLLTFLSGHGQTYFISLFGGAWREAFALSNAGLGGLYSLATLLSGLLVIALGRGVDRLPLPLFTAAVVLGAAAGGVALGAATAAWMLVPGFLLLRLCGQGLMMHVAQTTVARRIEARRGTAISLVTVGLPAGEAVLPALGVWLMAWLGWRGSWLMLAAGLAGVVLPLLLGLLRIEARVAADAERADERGDEAGTPAGAADASGAGDWTRGEVLRDKRFYRVLPALLAPPFLITALFFHQVVIATARGWPLEWVSAAFVAFAAAHVAALLASGPLVDRIGALPLLRVYLLPLLAALGVLGFLPGQAAAVIYLGLAGLSIGAAGTLMGALWPVLYGVRHLGAIRSLAHGAMVLSTAVAPVLVGALLDAGLGVQGLVSILAAYLLLAIGLVARLPDPPAARFVR